MSFFEVLRFPEQIAYGWSFGPGYSTDVVSQSSGFEQVNQNWDGSLMGGDVSHIAKSLADIKVLDTFFRVCKGRANGFRFKDFKDYTVTLAGTDGLLGTGAIGTGLPTYKLYKHYTNANGAENRRIQKPVAGQVSVYRGGVLVVAGAGAGQIAIDTTTGVITFVADSSSAVTAVTVGATTLVTLTAALAGLAIGGKLYLSGLTGSGAGTLNGLSHTISNITGGGLNVYTLSTVTTGLTITAAGSGYKYPQASEQLLWAGEFDVPARFDTDKMRPSAPTHNSFDWGTCPIIEKRIEDV